MPVVPKKKRPRSRQLTLRHRSDVLERRLKEEAEKRGVSVNALALEILARGVELDPVVEMVRAWATSTPSQARSLAADLASLRVIDDELWR